MSKPIKVLYPPGMQWEVMVQRPHHLLKLAAEAGWQVVWCELGPYRKPEAVLPNLWVVRDLHSVGEFAPFDLAYLTDPLQQKYIHPQIRPRWLIYDRCDPRGEREHKLIRQADLVLATTPYLLEEALQHGKRALLVPNAAELEHFKAGVKKKAGNPPIIGYMGVLAGHLDYRLLAELIGARPGYRWLFAGQEKGSYLPQAPNVHLIGHLPYAKLPDFLRQCDAALVPFLDTPHTRIVESVKIFEYLAAGKEVVASTLPPLKRRDWPIRLADGRESWLSALDAALAAGPFCEQAQIWVQEHSWKHRFTQIEQAVLALLAQKSN